MLLCDDICLKENLFSSAIGVFNAFKELYENESINFGKILIKSFI